MQADPEQVSARMKKSWITGTHSPQRHGAHRGSAEIFLLMSLLCVGSARSVSAVNGLSQFWLGLLLRELAGGYLKVLPNIFLEHLAPDFPLPC